jgi:molybdopterin-binding protein
MKISARNQLKGTIIEVVKIKASDVMVGVD